jgi:hypothetical protein
LGHYGLWPLYSVALYWSACLNLYGMMPLLLRTFPSADPTWSKDQLPLRMNPRHYCLCITRSIKFFLRSDVGLATQLSFAYPISCIAQAIYYHHLSYGDAESCNLLRDVGVLLHEFNPDAGESWAEAFIHEMKNTIEAFKNAAEPSGTCSLLLNRMTRIRHRLHRNILTNLTRSLYMVPCQ